VILKKLTKAKTALLAARATSAAKKAAKQIAKAQKQLDKIGTKADAFVSKPKKRDLGRVPRSHPGRDRARHAADRGEPYLSGVGVVSASQMACGLLGIPDRTLPL
jgi:hypothetical protein